MSLRKLHTNDITEEKLLVVLIVLYINYMLTQRPFKDKYSDYEKSTAHEKLFVYSFSELQH